MTLYTLHEDEDLRRALKRFQRKVNHAGTLRDMKRSRYYLKPSERRRQKARAAERSRWKHDQRETRRLESLAKNRTRLEWPSDWPTTEHEPNQEQPRIAQDRRTPGIHPLTRSETVGP